MLFVVVVVDVFSGWDDDDDGGGGGGGVSLLVEEDLGPCLLRNISNPLDFMVMVMGRDMITDIRMATIIMHTTVAVSFIP